MGRVRMAAALLVSLSCICFNLSAQEVAPNPPGKLYDIGGYRLHLNCHGEGSPTVILEYGASGNSMIWALVQPKVASFTRVCSYDRAYEGWSDAGPIPTTMRQQVYELHSLLQTAHIDPPYVLVGWSLGGMINRVYAASYPKDVSGMVLVDSAHEDMTMGHKKFRDMAKGKPIPPAQTMKTSPPIPLTPEEQKHVDDWTAGKVKASQEPTTYPWTLLSTEDLRLYRWADLHPKFASTSKGRQEEWLTEEFTEIHKSREGNPHPLGDIPLVVLAAGKGDRNAHEEIRAAELKDMTTLSTNRRLLVDETSDHGMVIENPEIIVQSIRDVLDAVKSHHQLNSGKN